MSQILPTFASQQEDADPICPIESRAGELLLLGQMELIKQNFELGCKLFAEASELKPNNPKIYFEQGLSLFEFGTEEGKEQGLSLANKKFKIATTLLPEYFEAWLLWGMTLSYLGKVLQKHHYFIEAEEKFQKAISLRHGQSSESLADLYREYAIVKMEIAEHSKEAHDWYLSMEAFETASTLSTQSEPDFWNQFGLACFALASQVNDIRLCVKAIHNFKHAITYEASNYEGWKNLSFAMSFLYETTHDEDHFAQANDCFGTCVHIHPLAENVWLDWALFLCKSGRNTSDIRRIQSSIDKCIKASAINDANSLIPIYLGEALSLLGELTEKMQYIREGQDKLLDASEEYPEDPKVWRALGESYISMGKYFGEYDYLYQAIEQFQQGLSIDRTCHDLWFSMGKAYSLIGTMLADTESLEKAESFYRKAINLYPRSSYYHFEYAYCLAKLGELSHEESHLESSIKEFEQVLAMQKNALYLHPDWLFEYAKALDLYADFFEEEIHYHKAIEIFSHILMIDPDFPQIHYHLALTHSHLGELIGEIEPFYRALHSFKLAAKHEEENDQILVDLGVTLINIAQHSSDSLEVEICYRDAEVKLTGAIKAGNLQGYYQMACLFSLLGDAEKSLAFLMKTESYSALPLIEDLLEDEWLDHVRCSEHFQNFLQYLERKSRQHEEL
jgi:tetratricopeptide (TPR) repeat protein